MSTGRIKYNSSGDDNFWKDFGGGEVVNPERGREGGRRCVPCQEEEEEEVAERLSVVLAVVEGVTASRVV